MLKLKLNDKELDGVFKLKLNDKERDKASLVTNRLCKRDGVDYTKTFALAVKPTTIR